MAAPATSTDALPSISVKIPRSLAPESLVFTLIVPLSELSELALRPVRWMLLVAWGLVNCEGEFRDQDGVLLHSDMPIDQLKADAVYTFSPGASASFHLMNLEHCYTKPTGPGSVHSSQLSSSSAATESTFPNRTEILAGRDGGRCMFSGRFARSATERAHVIPKRFSKNIDALLELAKERSFAVTHHLDPTNTMVLLSALHEQYDITSGFVLATDDRFLRDQDVPAPFGLIPPTEAWQARDAPTGQAYIWQCLKRIWHEDHPTYTVVQLNQRARFANDDARWYPCPRAVNYIYAAMMVEMYLDKTDEVRALLVRPVPPAQPVYAKSGSSGTETERKKSKTKSKKRKADRAYIDRQPEEAAPRRRTRSGGRVAVTRLPAFELMMRLADPRSLAKQSQPAEQDTMDSVRNWLKATPSFEPPEVPSPLYT